MNNYANDVLIFGFSIQKKLNKKVFLLKIDLTKMKTLKDFNFKNKKALVRVDFNVPLNDQF